VGAAAVGGGVGATGCVIGVAGSSSFLHEERSKDINRREKIDFIYVQANSGQKYR
jgi:hypothetical protein